MTYNCVPSHAVNVVGSRRRFSRIMIACGPFCAVCKRALRVEPCSCSSLQQSVEHKLGDWADDAIADSLSQLDDSPSAIITGALLVLLSPALNLQPQPYHISLLASVMQWRFPQGVYVFHLGIKRCCIFLPNNIVQQVSLKEALCALSIGNAQQIGLAIRRDGTMADLLVSCPN